MEERAPNVPSRENDNRFDVLRFFSELSETVMEECLSRDIFL